MTSSIASEAKVAQLAPAIAKHNAVFVRRFITNFPLFLLFLIRNFWKPRY
jgi:hypothetical protein